MKIVFYSTKCEYCKKLLEYLSKYNIKHLFKLVNIDIEQAPKEIDIVPTIVDTELNQPLKGKKAFEYLLNIKYFNNPTNNIEYIKDLPTNPEIKEDEKAIQSKTINLEINKIDSNNENSFNDCFKDNELKTLYDAKATETLKIQTSIPNNNSKLNILLQMKARHK